MCLEQSISAFVPVAGQGAERQLMTYPVRDVPRISMLKLAEYAVAPAGRRRTLLRDQRYPPTYKVASYSEAYSAIAEALVCGRDVKVLDAYIEDWSRRKASSAFQAASFKLWCAAAVAFKNLLAGGALEQYEFEDGVRDAHIDVGGVKVSIRPDALITSPATGALKLCFSKVSPLTADQGNRFGSASYAAAVLHQWVGTRVQEAPPKACLVVDVFAGTVHRAPMHFVRRRSDLTASCEEISKLWISIKKSSGSAGAASLSF